MAHVSDTDRQLIERTLGGNSEAFGELYGKYNERLRNSLVHRCAGYQDAEDVVQETFTRAYVKLESFRGDSQFYTWLYRIACNIERAKARGPKAQSLDNLIEVSGDSAALTLSREQRKNPDGAGNTENTDNPVYQWMEGIDKASMIYRAFQKMTEIQKEVIILREFGDYTYSQIAKAIGVQENTVRARIHKGRLNLKKQYLRLKEREK